MGIINDIKDLTVSVSVCTYNQVDYIEKCLVGILAQKTSFSFKLILGDDDSIDGTREICEEYAKRYPNVIELYLRQRKDVIYINGNPTGRYNFIKNLKSCTGKYIALCDGDDYWTDPNKLQKQVDFLETNKDYIITGHKLECINEKGEIIHVPQYCHDSYKMEASQFLLKTGFWIPTSSILFRNLNLDWSSFNKAPNGDTYLIARLGEYGKYSYLNDIDPFHYRIHNSGVWSTIQESSKLFNLSQTCYSIAQYFKTLDNEKKVIENLLHQNLRKTKSSTFQKLRFKQKLSAYQYLIKMSLWSQGVYKTIKFIGKLLFSYKLTSK